MLLGCCATFILFGLSCGRITTSSSVLPGGIGALFNIDFVSNVVTNVQIVDGGSGYSIPEILTFNGSLFPPGVDGVDDVTIEVNKIESFGQYSSIVGGNNNKIIGDYSFIGGGKSNTASGFYYETIGGGLCNKTSGQYSTIGGGFCNTASYYYSTVSGGYLNTSINGCSAILGGMCNTAQHDCSFIVGSGICSTAANTLHINCLNIRDLPNETAIGLPLGTVFYDSTTCNLCVCL